MANSLLAEKLAKIVHANQQDKAGKPYIEHLAFVANDVTPKDDDIIAVAWLHDSVEDTNVTLQYIRQIFGNTISEAIDAISKRDNETYEDYLIRVKSNPIARIVKLSDLKHNSDLNRLKQITDKDLKRIDKYQKAIQFLKT
ncbi:HD domain-containing protein [Mannheimia bovis]|uniref:HD domain-containing protein n=1 Tax=Mannheimia bovis TaxID=2770636 RepID=A0A7H1C0E4_9PAST|nr:HD domain-containing protein [Mannheimia bovis]QNS14449.1 HD domain-containing protein [Mannheimia bovis]